MKIPFWLYCIISTIIATCICGGLNAGITYVLYKGKEEETKMFAWPSTVAGDVVVTILLTSIITWFLSTHLTMLDCSKEQPFHIINKPRLESLPTYLHGLVHRAHYNIVYGSDLFRTAMQIVLTGTMIGLLLTLIVGTIFVVVGYYWTNDVWTMKALLIYKGVLGAFLGFILQPFIVVLAGTDLMETTTTTGEEEAEKQQQQTIKEDTAEVVEAAFADEEEEDSEKKDTMKSATATSTANDEDDNVNNPHVSVSVFMSSQDEENVETEVRAAATEP